MRIIVACFKGNLFPVKNCKKKSSPFLISKYVSPWTSKSFTLYIDMVNLNNICKWEAGSREGGGANPIFLSFDLK